MTETVSPFADLTSTILPSNSFSIASIIRFMSISFTYFSDWGILAAILCPAINTTLTSFIGKLTVTLSLSADTTRSFNVLSKYLSVFSSCLLPVSSFSLNNWISSDHLSASIFPSCTIVKTLNISSFMINSSFIHLLIA